MYKYIYAMQVKLIFYINQSLTSGRQCSWRLHNSSEGEFFFLACSSFPSPDAHKNTDGSSNFTSVERTSWNVLCVWWEVGRAAGLGFETPWSSLWKCRSLPQVLERSWGPGLKMNRPSNTSASGMRVTTCLLAQDTDTHLSKMVIKKERKANVNAK